MEGGHHHHHRHHHHQHHNHHDHDFWDSSQAVTSHNNTASSILWSNNNNQQVIDESFLMMSSSSSTNFLVPELKRIMSDSIVSNLTQEAMSFSCPSVNNNNNPFTDFIIAELSPAMVLAAEPPPASCSLESLECLLSATNSNADTGSIEDAADEGISAIFSEYQNLQNNTRQTTAGISASAMPAAETSGESISDEKVVEPVVANPNSSSKRSFFNSTLSPPATTTTAAASARDPSGFCLISDDGNIPRPKKLQRGASWSSSEKNRVITKPSTSSSSNINFSTNKVSPSGCSDPEPDPEAIAQMKEMIYRAAAFRPVNLGLETAEKPRRKNVRISSDPQTVAARQRRERISERIRVLQRLVPGGSKMDTASMLDEAASYLKFLRSQVKALEGLGQKIDSMNCPPTNIAFSFNPSFPMQTLPFQKPNHHLHHYH